MLLCKRRYVPLSAQKLMMSFYTYKATVARKQKIKVMLALDEYKGVRIIALKEFLKAV